MLFFITVSVLVVSANAVNYTDCGSMLATVQKASVRGCAEDAKVCVLQRNTNATFSRQRSDSSRDDGKWTDNGHPVTFSQPQPDGCKNSGLTCPLPASKSASLQTFVSILEAYPSVDVLVTWELINEYSQQITCVKFSVEIQ